MRTITHLAISGLATIAVLTGTAVTAVAQSDKITDKRADVVQYDGIEEIGGNGTVLNRADSLASGIDATSATVKHSKKSLKVTIRVAELTSQEISAYATIRLKGKKTPKYVIYSISKKKVGVFNLSNMKRLCTGKQTKKAGKKGTIAFSVARSCLKKPKAIKVEVGLGRLIEFDDENFTMYEDPISPSAIRRPKATGWLKAS
ncbi:hypothetical protein [Aeromicrobium sp. P5_D10]